MAALYARYLALYPRTTKAATAASIACLGDAAAQVHSGEPYSPQRAAAFVAWAALSTPLVHHWYLHLHRSTPLRATLLDQLVWAPPSTAVFLFWMGGCANGRVDEALGRVQSHLPVTLTANWALWFPFQLLNFRFIGPAYQILATNVVGLGWSGLLSTLAQPARGAPAPAAPV